MWILCYNLLSLSLKMWTWKFLFLVIFCSLSKSQSPDYWEEPELEAEDEDYIPENFGSNWDTTSKPQLGHFPKDGIAILGVPLKYGQELDGVQDGPRVLREALIDKLDNTGCYFEDFGDIEVKFLDNNGHDNDVHDNGNCGEVKFPRTVSRAVQDTETKVREVLKSRPELLILTLGGDHSLSMGTISATGSKYQNLIVIYIDAHGDINTVRSTVTGHLHGMPLSFLIRDSVLELENSKCEPFQSIKAVLEPSRLAYIATRDLDPPEIETIQRLDIVTLSPAVVRTKGTIETVRTILDTIDPERTSPFHVSFDVDAIDPMYTPSTGTRVVNGISLSEMMEIANEISKTGNLIALDVTELNPRINPNRAQNTINATIDVIMKFVNNNCDQQQKIKLKQKI